MAISSARLSAVIGALLDRRDRRIGERRDLPLQRGQRAGVDDHLLHRGDVAVVEIRGADLVEHRSLRGRRRGDGASQQWRRLALAEVATDRLAGDRSSPNAPITSSRIWNASPSGRP